MKKSHLFLIGVLLVLIGGSLTYRYFVRDVDSRGATKLMRAIENNEELKSTSKLIAKAQDINVRDKKGQTALVYAVRYSKDMDLVRQLLQAGADVNAVDNRGYTPLVIAAQYNPTPEIARLLIMYGANVNEPNPQGETPLMLAARHNVGPVIEALLRANANLDLSDISLERLITDNLKLSEVEKNNYRQLLLILSILEARANAKALATSGTEITPENVEEGIVLPTIDAPETSNQEEFSENEYYCENCEAPTENEVSPTN